MDVGKQYNTTDNINEVFSYAELCRAKMYHEYTSEEMKKKNFSKSEYAFRMKILKERHFRETLNHKDSFIALIYEFIWRNTIFRRRKTVFTEVEKQLWEVLRKTPRKSKRIKNRFLKQGHRTAHEIKKDIKTRSKTTFEFQYFPESEKKKKVDEEEQEPSEPLTGVEKLMKVIMSLFKKARKKYVDHQRQLDDIAEEKAKTNTYKKTKWTDNDKIRWEDIKKHRYFKQDYLATEAKCKNLNWLQAMVKWNNLHRAYRSYMRNHLRNINPYKMKRKFMYHRVRIPRSYGRDYKIYQNLLWGLKNLEAFKKDNHVEIAEFVNATPKNKVLKYMSIELYKAFYFAELEILNLEYKKKYPIGYQIVEWMYANFWEQLGLVFLRDKLLKRLKQESSRIDILDSFFSKKHVESYNSSKATWKGANFKDLINYWEKARLAKSLILVEYLRDYERHYKRKIEQFWWFNYKLDGIVSRRDLIDTQHKYNRFPGYNISLRNRVFHPTKRYLPWFQSRMSAYLQEKFEQDYKRVKPYWMRKPGLFGYKYDKNTPFMMDYELREKYTSKFILPKKKRKELFKILDKRRELMDSTQVYNFDSAYNYASIEKNNKVWLNSHPIWSKFVIFREDVKDFIWNSHKLFANLVYPKRWLKREDRFRMTRSEYNLSRKQKLSIFLFEKMRYLLYFSSPDIEWNTKSSARRRRFGIHSEVVKKELLFDSFIYSYKESWNHNEKGVQKVANEPYSVISKINQKFRWDIQQEYKEYVLKSARYKLWRRLDKKLEFIALRKQKAKKRRRDTHQLKTLVDPKKFYAWEHHTKAYEDALTRERFFNPGSYLARKLRKKEKVSRFQKRDWYMLALDRRLTQPMYRKHTNYYLCRYNFPVIPKDERFFDDYFRQKTHIKVQEHNVYELMKYYKQLNAYNKLRSKAIKVSKKVEEKITTANPTTWQDSVKSWLKGEISLQNKVQVGWGEQWEANQEDEEQSLKESVKAMEYEMTGNRNKSVKWFGRVKAGTDSAFAKTISRFKKTKKKMKRFHRKAGRVEGQWKMFKTKKTRTSKIRVRYAWRRNAVKIEANEFKWDAKYKFKVKARKLSSPRIFLKKLKLRQSWRWINPLKKQNFEFLNVYFRPYMNKITSLQKENIKKLSKNPDIFWFKFVRRDIYYLRNAQGLVIKPTQYKDPELIRKSNNILERYWWFLYKKALTEKEYNKYLPYLFKRNHLKLPKNGKNARNAKRLYEAFLPVELIPKFVWIKKYRYEGPRLYLFDEKSPNFSKYVGPRHIPNWFKYSEWWDCYVYSLTGPYWYAKAKANKIWCSIILSWFPSLFWPIVLSLSIIIYLYWFFSIVKDEMDAGVTWDAAKGVPVVKIQAINAKDRAWWRGRRMVPVNFHYSSEASHRFYFNLTFQSLIIVCIILPLLGKPVYLYKLYWTQLSFHPNFFVTISVFCLTMLIYGFIRYCFKTYADNLEKKYSFLYNFWEDELRYKVRFLEFKYSHLKTKLEKKADNILKNTEKY